MTIWQSANNHWHSTKLMVARARLSIIVVGDFPIFVLFDEIYKTVIDTCAVNILYAMKVIGILNQNTQQYHVSQRQLQGHGFESEGAKPRKSSPVQNLSNVDCCLAILTPLRSPNILILKWYCYFRCRCMVMLHAVSPGAGEVPKGGVLL